MEKASLVSPRNCAWPWMGKS